MKLFCQNDWDLLIVRLDDDAERLALIKSVQRYWKCHDCGARDLFAGLKFRLRRQGWLGAGLQCGEGLEVAIEINGRGGIAAEFAVA